MLITILVAAILIGIDQLTKYLVVQSLAAGGSFVVIPGVVDFRYHENTGAAFSFLTGHTTLLAIVTGVALLAVFLFLLIKKPADKLEYIALLMVFSGGVGNFIDRVAKGYVVDFINLLFMDFAIFNFADCLITVGFVILFFAVFRAEARAKKARDAKEANAPAQEETLHEAAAKGETEPAAPPAKESAPGPEKAGEPTAPAGEEDGTD